MGNGEQLLNGIEAFFWGDEGALELDRDDSYVTL